jgi:hypothetical protein
MLSNTVVDLLLFLGNAEILKLTHKLSIPPE